MIPFPLKVDEEIILQKLSGNNASTIFELVDKNREEFSLWFAWMHSTKSVEDISEFIFESTSKENQGGFLGLEIWYNNELVGLLDIHNCDTDNRNGELGFWLSGEHQFKGVMTRAVSAMIELVIKHLNINRVVIKTFLENERSKALAERLGFTKEGVEREAYKMPDEFKDLIVYSILAKDWEL